jgi:hypothetical protein
MGFFSWMTADTNESVANCHSDHSNANKTPYLLQPNGEPSLGGEVYEGYGCFGDTDAYEWLADINELPKECRERRIDGIRADDDAIQFPIKISYDPNAVYEDLPASKNCPDQGYFYESVFARW